MVTLLTRTNFQRQQALGLEVRGRPVNRLSGFALKRSYLAFRFGARASL